MVGVGITVGIRMSAETVGVLGATLGSAVFAALLLVVAGWGIASASTGWAPHPRWADGDLAGGARSADRPRDRGW